MFKVQPLAINELLYDVVLDKKGSKIHFLKNDISLALNLEAMNASKEVMDVLSQSVKSASIDGLTPGEASKVDNVFDAVNILNTRFVQSPADKVKALDYIKRNVDSEVQKLADEEKRAELQAKYDKFFANV